MRIFRIIGRSIQNAGKSILRNFSLSMASITCSIITLILVSIGMLLSYNINNITKNIENELTIVIFMDKNKEPNKSVIALIMGITIGLIIGVGSTYIFMKHQEKEKIKEYEKEKLSITEKLSLEINKLHKENDTIIEQNKEIIKLLKEGGKNYGTY